MQAIAVKMSQSQAQFSIPDAQPDSFREFFQFNSSFDLNSLPNPREIPDLQKSFDLQESIYIVETLRDDRIRI